MWQIKCTLSTKKIIMYLEGMLSNGKKSIKKGASVSFSQNSPYLFLHLIFPWYAALWYLQNITRKKWMFVFLSIFYNKQCLVLALRTMHCWNKHPLPFTWGNHLFCEHHVDDETLITSIKQNTQQRRKERTKREPKSKPEK